MGHLGLLLRKLRNRPAYRSCQEHARLQWLPRELVLEDQLERVRKLVAYAYRHTDYYRELLDSAGIKPEEIRSHADLGAIPVLTKEIIRNNLEQLLVRDFDRRQLIKNTSGGSTGVPLTFYQDKGLYLKMEANGLLALSLAGASGREKRFYFWGNPREFKGGKSLRTRLREKLLSEVIFNSYSYNQAKIAAWVEEIRKSGPSLLYGYTSVLTDVARYLQGEGIALGSVRGVLTTAEKLYGWQRELLERSFGARVFDQYGSREVPGMACECSHGGMHQLTHSACLEFVPDPALAGESRKLVVTCLTNLALPFIRYEIGDYARPREGECPCGRGLPLMEMDIGRTTDCFRTPEGNLVYGTFFVRQMYGQDRVSNFQFHQTAPDSIVLSVVPGPGFGAEDRERLESMQQVIHQQASPLMRLSIRYLSEIPRTGAGKHRFVISDLERSP